MVEYLGTESQVVGRLAGAGAAGAGNVGGDLRLVATLPGNAHPLLRQTLRLGVDAERLHVFDTRTGVTLRA